MNPPAPVTKISCDICMVAPVMDQQPERHDSKKREPQWLNHALHSRAATQEQCQRIVRNLWFLRPASVTWTRDGVLAPGRALRKGERNMKVLRQRVPILIALLPFMCDDQRSVERVREP